MTDDEVYKYLCIDSRIKKIESTMNKRKNSFYSQTMYTRTGYRDEQPAVISFNLELEVIDYASQTQMAENRIKVLKFKRKFFKQFWDGLDVIVQTYFKERYLYEEPILNVQLDKTIKNEIKEIEEATKHFLGTYQTHKNQIQELKGQDHLTAMLELLGV